MFKRKKFRMDRYTLSSQKLMGGDIVCRHLMSEETDMNKNLKLPGWTENHF